MQPKKSDSPFQIRSFSIEEVSAMTRISADVGWNQPEEEIREVILRSGKYLTGAFLNGELAGTAAAYPYPDTGTAFINEVIVESRSRRQGAAMRMLEELIPMTERDFSVLRLYATDMGRPLYEKFGFEPYAILAFGSLTDPEKDRVSDSHITPFSDNDLPEIVRLDKENFGSDRTSLLHSLAAKNLEDAWTLRRKGEINGFILRGPMSWLLQTHSTKDMASLIHFANRNSPRGPSDVLIHQAHIPNLPGQFQLHFTLTAMQRGNRLPPPGITCGSMLPDIG